MAKALEQEGVHVIYGLVGLKTHSEDHARGAQRRREDSLATCTSAPATTTA